MNYQEHDMKRGVDFIGVTVVFFCHDGKGKLLMYLRTDKCRDEHNTWDVGGGSMEFGETFEQAVRREVKEEYGAEAINLNFIRANNVVRKHNGTPTHWIALIFAVQVDPSEVKIGEPEKMGEIGWFAPESLPSPRHSMLDIHLGMVQEAGIL